MSLEKIYKNIILFHIALMLVSFLFGMYPSETIEEVNTILDQNRWFSSNASSAIALVVLMLIGLLVYFYSLYAMYKFKKIGRTLYLYTLVFFTAVILFMGNYAYSPIEFFFTEIYSMTNGALLVLIYLTNLKKKFK
jgi:uncharacterized membrane protein